MFQSIYVSGQRILFQMKNFQNYYLELCQLVFPFHLAILLNNYSPNFQQEYFQESLLTVWVQLCNYRSYGTIISLKVIMENLVRIKKLNQSRIFGRCDKRNFFLVIKYWISQFSLICTLFSRHIRVLNKNCKASLIFAGRIVSVM